MNKFLERLNAGEILVADGATGSNLQKMGLKPGRPPEDLIIDNPDIILKLASSFVEAGSDIILTCTFGGVRITTDAEVLNTDYQPIRGLYAAGELVGGLFYFNYPGGSGLTSGAVFGRIAGTAAARAGRN